MKLIKKLLLVLFVWQAVAVPFFVSPSEAQAATCADGGVSMVATNFPDDNVFVHDAQANPDPYANTYFALKFRTPPTQGTYVISAWEDRGVFEHKELGIRTNVIMDGTGDTTGNIPFQLNWRETSVSLYQARYLKLETPDGTNCRIVDFKVEPKPLGGATDLASCDVVAFTMPDPNDPNKLCNNCFETGKIFVSVSQAKDADGQLFSGYFAINVSPQWGIGNERFVMQNGTALVELTIPDNAVGTAYDIRVEHPLSETLICATSIPKIQVDCNYVNQCTYSNQGGINTPYKLCNQIQDAAIRLECEACAGGNQQNAGGVWTAIGCIDRNPEAIIVVLITIGLSMGGGVALLMILIAGFILSTSQGDPKRTGEAKEMVTAAVIGLIFVIFSVTILQFIGVTVLQIPGFGG